MWFLLLLIPATLGRLTLLSTNETFYTPYDMPRVIPNNFRYNVTGIVSFDRNDVTNRIVIIDSNAIVDITTVELQIKGALGAIYTSTSVTAELPGRRIAEFDNSRNFYIPAAEISYEDYLKLVAYNSTMSVTLEYEDNPWRETFSSGAFISYKVIRGIICLGCLILVTIMLIKLASRKDMKLVTINMSFMLFASIVFISSIIDQFGQDQLFPSKLAIALFTSGNMLVDLDLWLYVIVMMDLLKKNVAKTTKLLQNKWIYISIAIFTFVVEVVFISASVAVDPTSGSLNILQLIGYIIRMIMRITIGILYLVVSIRLHRFISKMNGKSNKKMRTKYTRRFNWVLAIFSILRGVFTTMVILLLNNPFTYTVFFWIEMLLTSAIMISLVLSPTLTIIEKEKLTSRTSEATLSTTQKQSASFVSASRKSASVTL
jgi:hypothetical protein